MRSSMRISEGYSAVVTEVLATRTEGSFGAGRRDRRTAFDYRETTERDKPKLKSRRDRHVNHVQVPNRCHRSNPS